MTLACLSFCGMAVLVRELAKDIPPLEIGFFRAFGGLLFMVPYALRAGKTIWQTENKKVYAARGCTGAIFIICFFPGVSLMEIADAQALTFTTPLFGFLLALFFLGENLSFQRGCALLIGFFGALVILRPHFDFTNLGAFLILISAIAAAASSTFLKFSTRKDAPDKIVFYHGLYMSPLVLLATLQEWRWPTLEQFLVLVIIAALATLNQRCLSRSFAVSDATAVLPFLFMRLPFGALLGFLVFGELPDFWIWVGGIIIFCSSLYLARFEVKVSKSGTF